MLQTKLIERQRELSLRDGEMAARLGIPRTTYSSMKVGRSRVSLELARRIARAFPDLAQYVLIDDHHELPASTSWRNDGPPVL